jgi:hypothetical protein
MNPRKILVLTGVVLLLFAFIILFERRMPTTEDRQRKGDLHWDLPVDRVDSLRLERQGDATLELKKTDAGAWRLVKPESYPADTFAALDLARELASLKRAGGSTAGMRPEEYGLTPPAVRATFSWTDEPAPQKKKTRTVEFGIEIPGMDIAAARVAGTETVIFVPGSVLAAVKKNANDFKSREVFGGSASDVASIDVERGRGHIVLTKKSGSWWLQQPVTDLADSGAAGRLAEELVAMRALDFVGSAEKENLATQGLAPPLFRVSLVDSKGARSSVDFGATRSDGNSVYARRETQVLTVPNTIMDELSREAIAFREAHLVIPDRSAVTLLEGVFGDNKYAVSRVEKGWTADGKPIVAAAGEDLLTALVNVRSKGFLDESDAAALKSQTPFATVRIALPPEPWEVRFFIAKTEVRATVSRRPGAFAMPPDTVTRLQEAFKKAATSVPTPVSTPARTPVPSPKKNP